MKGLREFFTIALVLTLIPVLVLAQPRWASAGTKNENLWHKFVIIKEGMPMVIAYVEGEGTEYGNKAMPSMKNIREAFIKDGWSYDVDDKIRRTVVEVCYITVRATSSRGLSIEMIIVRPAFSYNSRVYVEETFKIPILPHHEKEGSKIPSVVQKMNKRFLELKKNGLVEFSPTR